MSVEVVIPSLRQMEPERLVWSLAHQSHPPDIVTIVSNEVAPFLNPGTKLRLLRFSSTEYGYGDKDVVLRRNTGLWNSECDNVIFQDDDQIAPPTMVEDALTVLAEKPYVWGNHRLLDFSGLTTDEIMAKPASEGLSREDPVPPTLHGYASCYAGMFGVQTGFLRDVGGFDMAFNGLHRSEDQALGFRLMNREGLHRVWISEPPFSWHSIELKSVPTRDYLTPVTNGCGDDHLFVESKWDDVIYFQCTKCPVRRFDVQPLFREEPLIRYEPGLVSTASVWL